MPVPLAVLIHIYSFTLKKKTYPFQFLIHNFCLPRKPNKAIFDLSLLKSIADELFYFQKRLFLKFFQKANGSIPKFFLFFPNLLIDRPYVKFCREVSLVANEQSSISIKNISPWSRSNDSSLALFPFLLFKFMILEELAIDQKNT